MKESNGKERGVRMNLLDYTQKKVISLKDTNKIIDAEITRVRKLPKGTKGWFVDSRENGMLYTNDPVIRVKGVGKKAEEFLQRNSIKTVANLRAALTEERMKDIAQSPNSGLTVKALKRYLPNCQDASFKNALSITYFAETDNPFTARYGEEEDEWGQSE